MRARGLTRRQALQAGGAGALALGAASCGSDDYELETSRGGDAPNVLLIVTDSTRADFIGAYNRDTIARTPNIDALSREGLTFDLAVPEAMTTGPRVCAEPLQMAIFIDGFIGFGHG